MNIRGLIFSLLMVIGVQTMFAGGFQINEQGARAMAMGGAFTAIAYDPSAIYFNNAAITRLSGTQFMIGTTLIVPTGSFRGPYGPGVSNPTIAQTDMQKQTFFPSHAYMTYQYNDNLFFGLGFNTPFGLGTSWDDKWIGRFVSVKIDLKTFSFNPTVAYKLNDMISIGAGLQYNMGTVTIDRHAAIALSPSMPPLGEGSVALEGSTKSAIGFTAGLLLNPTKDLSVGLSYRSEVKYEFEGTAVTTNAPASFAASLPHGDITATLKSPAQFVVGLGYQATKNLLLSADFQYVQWSSYDSLKVDFKADNQKPIASPREYKNTYITRFGAEYMYTNSLALRAGLLFDKNPVPDERVDASLPDADRVGFSAGFGYWISSNLSVDASWLYLRFSERTVTTSKIAYTPTGSGYMNGTYNSTANLMSLSFSYKF